MSAVGLGPCEGHGTPAPHRPTTESPPSLTPRPVFAGPYTVDAAGRRSLSTEEHHVPIVPHVSHVSHQHPQHFLLQNQTHQNQPHQMHQRPPPPPPAPDVQWSTSLIVGASSPTEHPDSLRAGSCPVVAVTPGKVPGCGRSGSPRLNHKQEHQYHTPRPPRKVPSASANGRHCSGSSSPHPASRSPRLTFATPSTIPPPAPGVLDQASPGCAMASLQQQLHHPRPSGRSETRTDGTVNSSPHSDFSPSQSDHDGPLHSAGSGPHSGSELPGANSLSLHQLLNHANKDAPPSAVARSPQAIPAPPATAPRSESRLARSSSLMSDGGGVAGGLFEHFSALDGSMPAEVSTRAASTFSASLQSLQGSMTGPVLAETRFTRLRLPAGRAASTAALNVTEHRPGVTSVLSQSQKPVPVLTALRHPSLSVGAPTSGAVGGSPRRAMASSLPTPRDAEPNGRRSDRNRDRDGKKQRQQLSVSLPCPSDVNDTASPMNAHGASYEQHNDGTALASPGHRWHAGGREAFCTPGVVRASNHDQPSVVSPATHQRQASSPFSEAGGGASARGGQFSPVPRSESSTEDLNGRRRHAALVSRVRSAISRSVDDDEDDDDDVDGTGDNFASDEFERFRDRHSTESEAARNGSDRDRVHAHESTRHGIVRTRSGFGVGDSDSAATEGASSTAGLTDLSANCSPTPALPLAPLDGPFGCAVAVRARPTSKTASTAAESDLTAAEDRSDGSRHGDGHGEAHTRGGGRSCKWSTGTLEGSMSDASDPELNRQREGRGFDGVDCDDDGDAGGKNLLDDVQSVGDVVTSHTPTPTDVQVDAADADDLLGEPSAGLCPADGSVADPSAVEDRALAIPERRREASPTGNALIDDPIDDPSSSKALIGDLLRQQSVGQVQCSSTDDGEVAPTLQIQGAQVTAIYASTTSLDEASIAVQERPPLSDAAVAEEAAQRRQEALPFDALPHGHMSFMTVTTLKFTPRSGAELKTVVHAAPGLTSLDISGAAAVPGGAFGCLMWARSLESLDVSRTSFGDGGAAAVATLPGLQRLDVSWTRVRRGGTRHLLHCSALVSLEADGVEVDPEVSAAIEDRLWAQFE